MKSVVKTSPTFKMSPSQPPPKYSILKPSTYIILSAIDNDPQKMVLGIGLIVGKAHTSFHTALKGIEKICGFEDFRSEALEKNQDFEVWLVGGLKNGNTVMAVYSIRRIEKA